MDRYEISDEIHDYYVDLARRVVAAELKAKNIVPSNSKGETFHVKITLEGVGSVDANVCLDDANFQVRALFEAILNMKYPRHELPNFGFGSHRDF
jgi:hypothetical protein